MIEETEREEIETNIRRENNRLLSQGSAFRNWGYALSSTGRGMRFSVHLLWLVKEFHF